MTALQDGILQLYSHLLKDITLIPYFLIHSKNIHQKNIQGFAITDLKQTKTAKRKTIQLNVYCRETSNLNKLTPFLAGDIIALRSLSKEEIISKRLLDVYLSKFLPRYTVQSTISTNESITALMSINKATYDVPFFLILLQIRRAMVKNTE